jgi:adenylate cyclase
MATEIEYKFLVDPNWKNMLGGAHIDRCSHIRQGYLLNTKEKVVRVRIAGEEAFLTIKGARVGLSCPEFEYSIPVADAVQLMDMCDAVINKIRHVVLDENNQCWEIDVFGGLNEGLIMAELEVPNETTGVYLTPWLGKNVSEDHRYTNAQLIYNKAPNL